MYKDVFSWSRSALLVSDVASKNWSSNAKRLHHYFLPVNIIFSLNFFVCLQLMLAHIHYSRPCCCPQNTQLVSAAPLPDRWNESVVLSVHFVALLTAAIQLCWTFICEQTRESKSKYICKCMLLWTSKTPGRMMQCSWVSTLFPAQHSSNHGLLVPISDHTQQQTTWNWGVQDGLTFSLTKHR